MRARHILLSSEAEAKEAKKKLDAGKSFEDVAKDFSKDAGSRKVVAIWAISLRKKWCPNLPMLRFSLRKVKFRAL